MILSFYMADHSKHMLENFLISILLSLILVQASSKNEPQWKTHDEKYALVSFASQKFLKSQELVKMYSAFYGAFYEQNFKKNKTTPSSKKILSLYEIQDIISTRKRVNFEIIIDPTEFQVMTRDGAIYQNHFGEPFLFRTTNSFKTLQTQHQIDFDLLVLKDLNLKPVRSPLTPGELRQIFLTLHVIKKRCFKFFIRSFGSFIRLILFTLRKFNFHERKKIFLGIVMPFFLQFFKKQFSMFAL